jgi:hypothetical protein
MNKLNFDNIKINKISDIKVYENIQFLDESHDNFENYSANFSKNNIIDSNNQDVIDINIKLPLEIFYGNEIDLMIKNTKVNKNINKLPAFFVYKNFYVKEFREKYKIYYLPEIVTLCSKAWNKESEEMRNEIKNTTKMIINKRNIIQNINKNNRDNSNNSSNYKYKSQVKDLKKKNKNLEKELEKSKKEAEYWKKKYQEKEKEENQNIQDMNEISNNISHIEKFINNMNNMINLK